MWRGGGTGGRTAEDKEGGEGVGAPGHGCARMRGLDLMFGRGTLF